MRKEFSSISSTQLVRDLPSAKSKLIQGPVKITSHGRVDAVMISDTDFNEILRLTDSDAEGNVVAEGSWAVVDGKTCFTPTTEGVEAMCFTESEPAEDGSFTATPDEGGPVTVRPAAAAEAEDVAAE